MKLLRASLMIAALFLVSCISPTSGGLPIDVERASLLLLGEVHDNADGHRQRFALLQARVAAGWRPALAMEQFDVDRQADLDRALRSCADATCVVQLAGGSGWQWSFYLPVIELALRNRLPLLAANLSRVDAGRVMRGGFGVMFDAATVSRFGLDRPLPTDVASTQRVEIVVGHCNKLPAGIVDGMVDAQVARDIAMARILLPHADTRGAVLLAGNAHVRKDVGVPRWLIGVSTNRIVSIGYLEHASDIAEADSYDVVHRIAQQYRNDPCESL